MESGKIDSIITDLERQRASIERAIEALKDLQRDKPRRGRPKKVAAATATQLHQAAPPPMSPQVEEIPRRRHLSAKGRKAISIAQQRRWKAQKKAS